MTFLWEHGCLSALAGRDFMYMYLCVVWEFRWYGHCIRTYYLRNLPLQQHIHRLFVTETESISFRIPKWRVNNGHIQTRPFFLLQIWNMLFGRGQWKLACRVLLWERFIKACILIQHALCGQNYVDTWTVFPPDVEPAAGIWSHSDIHGLEVRALCILLQFFHYNH